MVTDETYTARLTRFLADLQYADLPAAAVAETKNIVLDTLGAALMASSERYSSSWLSGELARQMGGAPDCTVIGRDFKTSVESAALANGTIAYAADAEGGRAARQHAAAVLVPAALAVAERGGLSGKALITALVVGYEVACRVGEACRTDASYVRSFHPSALYGHFGAAGTAGKLLGLDQAKLAIAIGLAGSNAGGLMTWVDDVTENSRPLVIGLAARGGVTAALLADLGFGGPPAILDPGKYSIYDAYAGEMRLEQVLAGLGETFWVNRTIGYKRHPCCGDIHTGLDALINLREKHGFAPEDIVEIEHRLKADRAHVVDNNVLKSHCAQYIMAVAAVEGRIRSDDILIDRRSDPRVAELFGRVRVVHDPEMNSLPSQGPARVTVTTRQGDRFSESVIWPLGHPNNPFSQADFEAKCLDQAAARLPRERAERLLEVVGRLEQVEDVREVAELVRA